jgi:hypothetical protein
LLAPSHLKDRLPILQLEKRRLQVSWIDLPGMYSTTSRALAQSPGLNRVALKLAKRVQDAPEGLP